MVQLSSKDSSRNLHVDCAVSFRFYPHLIFYACVQTFYVTFWPKICWELHFLQEFIVNSRGKKLFTCRWIPQNFQPKALIFICHGTTILNPGLYKQFPAQNQTHYCHSWFLFCRNCSRVQHINERYHCHPLVLLIWQEFLNNRCGSNIVGNNNFVQNNSSRK